MNFELENLRVENASLHDAVKELKASNTVLSERNKALQADCMGYEAAFNEQRSSLMSDVADAFEPLYDDPDVPVAVKEQIKRVVGRLRGR